MRFPKLNELLGRLDLGPLMKKLFSRPGMQVGNTLKRSEEVSPARRFLGRMFGSAPEVPKRARTATPDATNVLRSLAGQRREGAQSSRAARGTQPAAATSVQPRSRPTILQRAGNVYQSIRNAITNMGSPSPAGRPQGAQRAPAPGTMVQVNIPGAGQPAEPRRVTGTQLRDGQHFVTVEGSPTPIPVSQVTVVAGGSRATSPTTATPDVSQAIPEVSPAAASQSGPQPQAPALGLGAMIQWRTGGMDQFPEPRRVSYVSDDRRFVRVEGSRHGIPADQVTVVHGAPSTAGQGQPPASGAQKAPWWQSPPAMQGRGSPLGPAEPVWKMMLRDKWQSLFGAKAGRRSRRTPRTASVRHREAAAATAASSPAGSAPVAEVVGGAPPIQTAPPIHKHFASFFGHRSSWTSAGTGGTGSPGHAMPRPTTATPEAASVMRGTASRAAGKAQSRKSKRMDRIQSALDIAGIFDPTPILDGINAMISLKRAKDEPERRSEHMENAAISGISMLPGIGDLAKLKKLGRGTSGAAAGAKTASGSRSFAQMVGRGLELPKQMWTDGVVRSASGIKARGAQLHDRAAMAMFGDSAKSSIKPATAEEVQKRGFGDIAAGRKTADQVKKEIEGERTLIEAKKKLAESVKLLTGSFGTAGKIVSGLATAAVGLTKGLQTVNAMRLAQQSELGYVSGAIGTATAKREYAKFEGDVETARKTSRSHSRLSDSQIGLERALRPSNNLITNLFNNVSADITRWVTKIIEAINRSAESARESAISGGGRVGEIGGRMFGPGGDIIGGAVSRYGIRSALDDGGEPVPDSSPPWNRFIDSSIEAAKPKGAPKF